MKIIHCADLHLDSKMERIPAEKAKIRREEVLRTFERLCDYASENEVSAVIIAGDMFDTSRVTVKTRGRVLSAIAKNSKVDFLYLSGNHDDENFIINSEELPNNLKTFSDIWTTYSYGDVRITGVKLTPINSVSVYDTLALENDKFNIVVMHGQLVGYKTTEAAEIISIPRLKDKNIDYLALGHIHSYSEGQIDLRGKYAYSGCLEGRGFDETGSKGFNLIEINDKKAEYNFINFSSRNLYEFEFTVEGEDSYFSLRDKILSSLKDSIKETSLIKVVLKGGHAPEFDIDKEGLTARLNEEFFFAKVYDKTELKYNIEDYALDKSILGEFIRAVDESDLDELAKRKVIMCGINALKGEEI